MMKIAIDCRMCGKSGIGAFIDGILPHILSTDNEFLLIGLDNNSKIPIIKDSQYNIAKVTFLPCDISPFSLKETFFFPAKLCKKINECSAFISPYCNIPSGIHIPVYCTIHDVVFLDVKLAGRLGTFARKRFYCHAVRKSKAIFTVSEFSKNRIIKQLNCNKPVHVVHSSVPEYLQEALSPLPKKTDTIIFIGNIKHHKGLHTLIPAFELFRLQCKKEDLPIPKLLIIGEKNNFRTKDTALSKISETEGLEFTGFISNEKLKVLLSEAKILVQPSLYEGFGLPPLEALSCGTRAIVSDIPVFREVYEGLPVIFFQTENTEDLSNKLLLIWKENKILPPTKSKYSFQLTARAMLSIIDN